MKIELRNIAKKYEGRENYTLENINLTIEHNDFCIILGPSGCGKTTLLRMIAGLNSITKGDLLFDGVRVNGLTPKERDIAMVFQSYALYPHLTNYKNIAFGLKVRKERKDVIDRRVKDVSKILEVEEYLTNKPSDISGGQRQRIALGRAIARKPKLFLMDEPLSNLDAKLRESMRTELVKIHKMMNTTTIYVTHDQLEAMTMATKIIVMNNSIIQQIGTSKDLYYRPINLFIAKFIGTPTMNIYDGELEGNDFISKDKTIKVKLKNDQIKKIKNLKIKNISLGIRSEDITFVKTKTSANTKSIATIVEMLGKEQEVKFENKNCKTTMTTPSDLEIEFYKEYYLKFNPEKIHIFDTESTTRIN
ncbi:MAG: ABC transporter ATP-binding protein [Mycoplasmatales bacterium]|nr:ABC transporter ATP-binding protein [Mycoplasmatales bacterium]